MAQSGPPRKRNAARPKRAPSPAPAPPGASPPDEPQTPQPTFIFEGAVLAVGSTTLTEVEATEHTIVAQVDAVHEGPSLVQDFVGHPVTVRLGEGQSVEVGQAYVFHTVSWVFGSGLAVICLSLEPAHEQTLAPLQARAAAAPTQAMLARAQGADLVVNGHVSEVREVPRDPGQPITEHDPHWQDAVVQVHDTPHQAAGAAAPDNVLVRFSGSRDVRWAKAPKFRVASAAYGCWATPLRRSPRRAVPWRWRPITTFAWNLRTSSLKNMPRPPLRCSFHGRPPGQPSWDAQEAPAMSNIRVVNIIPQALSGETGQDSEPNIAVNPANPNEIAITAFTSDPLGGPNAPIFISTDGGSTWSLNSNVPSNAITGDITPRFGGGSRFYAGILRRPGNLRLNILRTANFASASTMTVLVDRNNVDQPYTEAQQVPSGPDAGKDRVYVGINDLAQRSTTGRTATVETSQDGAAAAAAFVSARIERRDTGTAGQNGPQVRPATHSDGTVYAVFTVGGPLPTAARSPATWWWCATIIGAVAPIRFGPGGSRGQPGRPPCGHWRQLRFQRYFGSGATWRRPVNRGRPGQQQHCLHRVVRPAGRHLHATRPALHRPRGDMVGGRPAHDRSRQESGPGDQQP